MPAFTSTPTPCQGRRGVRLGAAAGLTQFAAKLKTLAPGAWASQRHWHQHEGELVLVEDAGETVP